jgi:glycerate 2-kinase
MINISASINHSLPGKEKITQILQAALDAADPKLAVINSIKREGDTIFAGKEKYDLNSYKNIFLIGAGKAAFEMSQGVLGILGEKISRGLIIVKYLPENPAKFASSCMKIVEGSHPQPDNKSIESSRELFQIAAQADSDDLVIFLLSGGASALMTSPRSGINLFDLQELTRLLLSCGAEIQEINIIRKHLDDLKGGGLARIVYPAEMLSLILSDVVASPLDAIGSGPTVADRSTFIDAYEVLKKYDLIERTPDNILKVLRDGIARQIDETVKDGDPVLAKVNNILVGSNEKAANAGLNAAVNLGFESRLITTNLQGEARKVGSDLGKLLKETCLSTKKPVCMIAGGETTVTLIGKGKGGRNQELALAAVQEMAEIKDAALISLATDGDDGPTGAAGAVVTGDTLLKANRAGVDLQSFLDNNDSFSFFEKINGLIVTGATGTNVNDLVFLFANLSNLGEGK